MEAFRQNIESLNINDDEDYFDLDPEKELGIASNKKNSKGKNKSVKMSD